MKQQSIKIILTLFFFYILPDLFSQPLPPTPPPQPKSVDVIFNDGSSTTANEVNVCSSQFVQFNVNGDAYNKSKNYALWYELDEGPWFFNSDDNCPGCNSGPDKTTFLAKGKTYTTKADRNKIIMVVYAVDTNGMTIIGLCRWVHIKLIYKPDNISAILGLDSVCRLSNNLEYSVSPVDSATGYKWVLPQGFSGAGITNNINVNITGQALPGYIYVNAYNQCGNSPQSKLFINVDSLPPKPVKPIGSKSLCINNPNTTYRTIPLANAAFYEWKLKPDSAGEIIANPNLKNDFISVDWNNEFTGTASIEVRASNYCGTSPFSDSLVINIHPLPDSASNIFGIDKPCINSNDIPFYTEAINHSNNYVWTLPDGATGTSNSQTILISFTAQAKAGQISVSGKNNCGTGKAAYKNIEIDYPATKADKPSGNNFICLNNPNSIYTTTGAQYAASYNWQLYPSIAGSVFSNNKIANIVWNNNYSGSCWLKVQGVNNCGAGVFSDSISIYLQPLPETPETPAGATKTCNNVDFSEYYISKVRDAETYIWQVIPEEAGVLTVKDTILQIKWNLNFSGTAQLQVKAANLCGESELSKALLINVIPLPAAPVSISGIDNPCADNLDVIFSIDPVKYSDNYIWTLPEGATGTSSTNNISVKFSKDAIPGKITVKGTNQCGEGIEATKDINILYLPAKAAAPTGNNFICANNDYNIYSTTGAAYAQNYKWVLYPANAGNIFENNKTATIYWNKTYAGYCYLKLKAENTCGSGLYSDSLSIYLQPLPSTPGLPAGLTRVCNNSGQTLYNVNKIKYSDTYTWELIPSNAGKLNVSDTLVKISWDSSFTGSVLLRTKAGNICGESSFGPPLNIELISKPAQAGTISGLDSLCEGTNGATYSIVPVNNTESYQWNLPQGATGISASNKIIVDFALQASAGKISVKAYNQCGFGKAAFKDITIKYKPGQAAKPKGEQHICLNQSNNTIYSSDGALYASSYLWELTPGNAGSVYSNNKNVNIIWNTNYSGIVNLKLKGVNNCGSGQFSDSLLINLDHQPDPPLTPAGATPICNNSGTSLYLIPEVNNTTNYKWELFPAEAATMLQNGTNVNLKLDSLFAGYALLNVKAVNTCGESSSSPSFKINITSKPYPAGFISGLDSVCEAAIGMNYEIVALSNADDYVWTLAEDFSGSSLSNKINVNFSKNAHNGKITVSGKNSCGLGKASIKNITIKHYPLKPATPTGSELICLNTVSNSLYTSSGALYATSYIWNLEPANAGTIWSDNKSASIIWNKNYKGYARLKLKGVNNCGGGVWSDSLNIFIEQLPAVPAIATGDLLPCNNISFSEYKIPLIENALQYNWELNPASAAILTPYCSLYPDSCVRYPELAGAIIVKWDSLFYGAVQLKVNSENQCGLSDLSPALNINVNTKPSEAAYIFGLDSLCEGTTVADYYINPVARAEHYNWLLAEGITGESDSSHILLNFNKGETLSKIKVYASNNCGQGKAAYKSIYTKPLPLMRGCSQLPGIAICCLDSSGSACPSVLCFNPPDMEFKIDSANYALNYEWSIEPPEAGYINYNRLHAKVNWNDTYSGGVTIRVKAINNCGYSLQDAMHKLYINAAPQFSLPLLSEGPIITCQKTKSVYHFKALNDTLNYQWTLNPPSAGILTSYKDSLYIEWDSAYLDTSRLIYKVSNQCSMGLYTDSLTISVNSIPEPARTVSGDTLLCQGLSEVVFSTPAIKYATNYNWLFPKGFSFSGNPDSSVVKVNISDSAITGAIYIRGSNICGLGEAASMQLTVKALPVKPFIYSHNLKLCYYSEKSSVYIKKEPGVISYNYILNPPNAGVFSDVDNNPIITWDPDFTGEAFLQIQTANDCGYGKYCDPLKFSINIPEQVKLPSDTTINLPQSITISTDKDYKTYNWSNTSIDKQITIHSETLGIGSHIYSVTVTDFNDCFSHDSITIKVDSALKNIINPSLAKQINAYYNLTDKRIYIKSSINLENTKLALYNNEGQKLYSLYINSIPANSTYSFSLNNNSATAPNPRKDTNPALYFLNIINNSFNITKKLIIY